MNLASEIYNKVYNDDKIRDIYKKINDKEELNDDAWGHHNFNHVNNVKDIVVQILSKLNCDSEFIEEAKIAAILHDVGALQGKPNHAYRSFEFSKQYFKEHNIKLRDNELVLEAIKNHSDGFDTDNLIQLSLILADKLDIKYTRPTKCGLKVPGNRQYKNITDIHTNIEDGILKIEFLANNELDKKELEEYYFMKKVANAIKSFANKFNLKYQVYLNNSEWHEMCR